MSLIFYFLPIVIAVVLVVIWLATVGYLGVLASRCGVRIAGNELCVVSLWGEKCLPIDGIEVVKYRQSPLWNFVTPYSMAGGSYGLVVRDGSSVRAKTFVRIPSTLGSNRDENLFRQVQEAFALIGISVVSPSRDRRRRPA